MKKSRIPKTIWLSLAHVCLTLAVGLVMLTAQANPTEGGDTEPMTEGGKRAPGEAVTNPGNADKLAATEYYANPATRPNDARGIGLEAAINISPCIECILKTAVSTGDPCDNRAAFVPTTCSLPDRTQEARSEDPTKLVN